MHDRSRAIKLRCGRLTLTAAAVVAAAVVAAAVAVASLPPSLAKQEAEEEKRGEVEESSLMLHMKN